MKNNLLHICFILDESGSIYSSSEDVINGFNKLINEQKQLQNGECIISVYRFANTVDTATKYITKSLEYDTIKYFMNKA